MRRTLVRIAHEIVEKNPDGAIALVGIHRRGALLAQRLHALTSELLDTTVPLGFVDISFYRDDLAIRPSAPIVHATQLDFPVDGRTIVIVDDVLYTGRTVRAAIDEIFDYGRPARVQLAVLVDRGHRELPIRPDYVGKNIPTSQSERVNVRVEEIDGRDEVTIGPARPTGGRVTRIGRHLISIDDLDRAGIERILDRAESFAEVSGREIKKVPALRGRTVVNLFYEASTRTSSSFELAAKRLSADVVSVRSAGSSVDKGESLKDTVQTLSAYDPAAIVIRSPHVGAAQLVAGWTAGRGDQRRRRQARAPDPGAARRVHAAPPARRARRRADLDRRRRPALAGRALEHPRAAADGGGGDRLRAADADPARHRGARLRGGRDARPACTRPTSSTCCGCSTSGCTTRSCPRCASTPRATRSTPPGCARASC